MIGQMIVVPDRTTLILDVAHLSPSTMRRLIQGRVLAVGDLRFYSKGELQEILEHSSRAFAEVQELAYRARISFRPEGPEE